MAGSATLQEQALAAFSSHAETATLPSPQILDDLAAFQQVLFTNPQVRAVEVTVAAGRCLLIPIRRSPTWKNWAKLSSRGRAANATAALVSRHHRHPSFGSRAVATQCPRPIDPVSPARFAFASCPPRLARNARTYEIVLSVPTPSPTGLLPSRDKNPAYQLGSRTRFDHRIRGRASGVG